MRDLFQEQLNELKRELTVMGASCEEIIALASQALTGWDAELVQKVSTIGGQIDESERTIETICMKLLLRQQPVARDLRQISAAIWDEVKDRLKKNALGMSGGQQQRICIARALAVEPKVLLMAEPTSALDPISTSRIEDLAMELKKDYTIVMVTHNMQQAVRISDQTAFFLLGDLVEYGNTEQMFSQPEDPHTEDYITGRFG